MGRRGKDYFYAVVYELDPLLCSSSELDPLLCSLSAAGMIRKLYKFHLVLELSSSAITLCRAWGI